MAPPLLKVSSEEEYARNPDLKKEDITHLLAWILTQKHLPAIPEEMVILLHHSCYYNLDRTKDCIETYYTMRTNTPEFFTNRDVTQPVLAKALSALHYTTLPKRDPKGNLMLYHGLREFEPSKYMFVDGIKLLLMTMDSLYQQSGTSPGVIILFNMQGARLTHLTRISISPIRKFFQYIQEGNPVRLKAIHLLNTVPFIDKILTLIKPFMKKELMNLLHFHTGDMESFYQHVPKECLPSDFGGELESLDVLCDAHNKQLESLAGYFEEEGKIRNDESKRQKGKKSKNEEPVISFEKLEID